MKKDEPEIGIGPAPELDLRVSVGTLARVIFKHPENGRVMMAMERTATLRETDGMEEVNVKAKPFGGGIRIIHPEELALRIGNFNYDSERSRHEQDFRIMINRASWDHVKKICREHLEDVKLYVLDFSPDRELAEEFEDCLGISLTPREYLLKQVGIIYEDKAAGTDNIRARGIPTVRVYYIFEARITSPGIVRLMLDNSKRYSDDDLRDLARADAKNGGKGRANAVLSLDLEEVIHFYRTIPEGKWGDLLQFGDHLLAGNVAAVLHIPEGKLSGPLL